MSLIRLRRGRRGVGALEFALTLPFILLVLLGIVELSILMHRVYVVSRAARDACRIGAGVIEGIEPTGDDIEFAAESHARFALNAANVDCGAGCNIFAQWFQDETDGWMLLRCRVGVPYEPLTTLMPMIPDMTRREFIMLTQQQIPPIE